MLLPEAIWNSVERDSGTGPCWEEEGSEGNMGAGGPGQAKWKGEEAKERKKIGRRKE